MVIGISYRAWDTVRSIISTPDSFLTGSISMVAIFLLSLFFPFLLPVILFITYVLVIIIPFFNFRVNFVTYVIWDATSESYVVKYGDNNNSISSSISTIKNKNIEIGDTYNPTNSANSSRVSSDEEASQLESKESKTLALEMQVAERRKSSISEGKKDTSIPSPPSDVHSDVHSEVHIHSDVRISSVISPKQDILFETWDIEMIFSEIFPKDTEMHNDILRVHQRLDGLETTVQNIFLMLQRMEKDK